MKRARLVLCLLTSVTFYGCSGDAGLSGLAPTSGIVTQKGAPLAGAVVSFVPSSPSNRAAVGTTGPDGRFKLTTLQADDGAMPGDYKVTVTKIVTEGKVYSPEEANEYYAKNMKQPPPPQSKNAVAEKFSKAETTTLQASVKKGKNDFTFDVE